VMELVTMHVGSDPNAINVCQQNSLTSFTTTWLLQTILDDTRTSFAPSAKQPYRLVTT